MNEKSLSDIQVALEHALECAWYCELPERQQRHPELVARAASWRTRAADLSREIEVKP